jgi:hypothetical protein
MNAHPKKIAISIDGDCVAPVFDFARRLLVVTCSAGKIAERRQLLLSGVLPPLRASRLSSEGIIVLMCGVISYPLAAMLRHQGIEIIDEVSGNAVDALDWYVNRPVRGANVPAPTLTADSRRRCRGHHAMHVQGRSIQ